MISSMLVVAWILFDRLEPLLELQFVAHFGQVVAGLLLGLKNCAHGIHPSSVCRGPLRDTTPATSGPRTRTPACIMALKLEDLAIGEHAGVIAFRIFLDFLHRQCAGAGL